MKPLLIILLSLLFSTLEGQVIDTIRISKYSVGISRFNSSSGFRPGTDFYFLFTEQKRSIGFGFLYCPEQRKISGISIHYETTLSSSLKSNFSPYLFYNLVYRFTRTEAILNEQPVESTYGLYKSMEHHIGMGMNVKILKNIHAKASMGYGVYFGSIKKPVYDSFTKEVTGSNGFSAIGMIAMEYTF